MTDRHFLNIMLGWSVVFVLIVGIYSGWTLLIADEVAYFEQGLAISKGTLSCPAWLDHFAARQYPLGTSLLIGILIGLLGKQGAFFISPISLIVTITALFKIIKHFHWQKYALFLPFIFPPVLILQNRLMSDLPSMALFSVFLYFILAKEDKPFFFGFLAALLLLFREPNLLLVLPFLASYFVKTTKNAGIRLLLGFFSGIGLRMLFAWMAYRAPFFIKNPNISFSGSLLGQNLILYGSLLFILLPLAGISVFRYKGKYRGAFLWSFLSFLLLYLLYDYNGYESSGVKSLVLGGRFLVPVLPLIVLAVAQTDFYGTSLGRRFRMALPALATASLLLSSLLLFKANTEQRKIVNTFYCKKSDGIHFYHNDSESLKCLSSLYGENQYQLFNEDLIKNTQERIYLHVFGGFRPEIPELTLVCEYEAPLLQKEIKTYLINSSQQRE